MKVPKAKKRYCKFCKGHTNQKVSEAKRRGHGATHTMARSIFPEIFNMFAPAFGLEHPPVARTGDRTWRPLEALPRTGHR